MQSDNKTVSLWTTFGKIRDLLDAIESAEEMAHGSMIDAFVGDIMTLLKNADEGVDKCVGFVKFAESENVTIEQEIGRLLALKRRNIRSIERIKGLAQALMETVGAEKLEGTLGRSFSLRETSAVKVLSLDQIPDMFKRITTSVEPDKAAILKILRADGKVSGTEIEYRKSVVVK